jgi:hypothetical protein
LSLKTPYPEIYVRKELAMPLVRLKYAESDNFSPGGGVTGVNVTKVSAKVKNIAFTKEVSLVCALSDGTWVQKAMSWQAGFGNYDLFSLSDGSFVTDEFAIRYDVNGQTDWDNNNGANYQISEIQPNTAGGNVVLNTAVAHQGSEPGGGFVFTTSWVEGEIYVKNLSFNKRVGIRLSTNGWASFLDTNASFNASVSVAEGLSKVESWKFKTPEFNIDESNPNFNFAIFYNNLDTGEWFWDDNFSQSYSLSKAPAATDQ